MGRKRDEMMHRLTIFISLAIFVGFSSSVRVGGVFNRDGIIEPIEERFDGPCHVSYLDTLDQIGWDQLNITTNSQYPDAVQMYCAGLMEGLTTSKRIGQWFQSWRYNEFDGKPLSRTMTKYLQAQMIFSRSDNVKHPEIRRQVRLLMDQFDGLYTAARIFDEDLPAITQIELYALISDGDLETLVPLYQNDSSRAMRHREKMMQQKRSNDDVTIPKMLDCSGFIKMTEDDLLVGHTTWTRYYSMFRIMKRYDFNLKDVSAVRMTFSSRPAFLCSKDDFYAMDSGLVAWETTNEIMDETLFKFIDPSTLMTWQRAMISNRLAKDGEEWTDLFSMHNSGTYNNQWAVTDYNKFVDGQAQPGTLWIIEQIPHSTFAKDVTEVLKEKSYWPSFNVPYLKETYVTSGYGNCTKDGNCTQYTEDVRYQLFERLQIDVHNISGIKHVMQYNDYTHDNISMGHSSRAVSSRYDLETEEKNVSAFGGIDSKVVSVQLMKEFSVEAISGPSHQSLKPFRWSIYNEAHPLLKKEWTVGLPEEWDFDWRLCLECLSSESSRSIGVEHRTRLERPAFSPNEKSRSMRAVSLFVILFIGCVLGQCNCKPTVAPSPSFAAQVFSILPNAEYAYTYSGMLYHDGKGRMASKFDLESEISDRLHKDSWRLLQPNGTSLSYENEISQNGTQDCQYTLSKNKFSYDLFSWILTERVYYVPAGGEDYYGYPCDLWKRPVKGSPTRSDDKGKYIEVVCVSQQDPTVPVYHQWKNDITNEITYFLTFKPTTSFGNIFEPPQQCPLSSD
ncbi:phospholipase B-like protein [Planoprotostelium fungivorum]|uniref:Phospholipase B-like n=1 Tax=Planoprotostelium fungivorum TaxID=1890364 RepID=A0A2P6NTB0_9EUKA|nr:phospholipase B-like protein [Planoprotostelium fungivorum]